MAQATLITDEMKKSINKLLFTQAVEIERGMITRFAEGVQDPNPLWQDEDYARKTKYGTIIAPPSFIHSLNYVAKPSLKVTPVELVPFKVVGKLILDGSIDCEYLYPIRPGDTLFSNIVLSNVYEKGRSSNNPMLFVTLDIIWWNQKGQMVAKVVRTTIFR